MTPRHPHLQMLRSAQVAFPIGSRPWKDRILRKLLSATAAAALCLGPAPSQAHTPLGNGLSAVQNAMAQLSSPQEAGWMTPERAQESAPFAEIGALDSKPGESKEDFLLRVGRMLEAFTQNTQHEACGAIMATSDLSAWRVRLITNRAQTACVRILFDEPGFPVVQESIHSHPHSPKNNKDLYVRANYMDRWLRGLDCGRGYQIDDADFSPGDRDNGGGYLVARGKLLYLGSKEGDSRIVGTLDLTQPLDELRMGGVHGLPKSQPGVHASTVWTLQEQEGLPLMRCNRPKS